MNDSQFSQIQNWFETLNVKFEDMNVRLEDLNTKMDQKFADVDARFEQIDARLDKIEIDMESGFNAVHNDLAILKSTARRTESRMAFLESNTHNLQTSDYDQQDSIRDLHVRLLRVEDQVQNHVGA
ncbi:MAG: hypothetical protein ACPGRX_07280 [Bdellovibrionales bacterium]